MTDHKMPPDVETLHRSINDALEGYRKLAGKADGDLKAYVSLLIQLHEEHANSLTTLDEGLEPGARTSFMADVHKAVVGLRDLFDDLDRDLLPALVNGEKRIVSNYDDALEAVAPDSTPARILRQQRDELRSTIQNLEHAA